MSIDKEDAELADDDEPVNPDSVSDPGEETEEGPFEQETKVQSDEGFSSFSGEAELKPRTDFPPDDRY